MQNKIDPNTLPSENFDDELTPLKRNLLRIISAILFAFLIWGTVTITDYVINIIGNLFN